MDKHLYDESRTSGYLNNTAEIISACARPYGFNGVAFGIAANVAGNRGKADGNDATQINMHVTTGNLRIPGLCGTCKLRCLSGEVDHCDFILSDDEHLEYLTLRL